jgi:hypothetical protein
VKLGNNPIGYVQGRENNSNKLNNNNNNNNKLKKSQHCQNSLRRIL